MKNFKFRLILSICLVCLCAGVFLFLAIKVKTSGNFEVDYNFIDFSIKIRNKPLTNILKVLTYLGSMLTVAILAVVMAVVCKPIWVKIFSVVNVGAVAVFCWVVKHIVERPRPEGVALIVETGFSFPSAHTMGSVVFYGFLIFLIWKYLKNKPFNITLSVIVPVLVLIIGYSRIYLGVHYFTDVLVGLVCGIAYLTVAIFVFELLENKVKFSRGSNEKK